MHLAISATNLSKRYWIGQGLTPAYSTLRDAMANAVRNPREAFKKQPREESWALRDVSFEIAAGSVTGIVGANGAGKSTLLKLLSRITRPTSGRAELYGRIASMLEVGTGFHPELTGRHNVFLNGAILGMTQREITANFDAIVDFSGVERFIDTPVKFYSTGMFLRLAFAVAAHLRSDILAVDEVLAVGDVLFQRKCLGKMEEVARDGRTVLLVSHNLTSIQSMCDNSLWLHRGRLELQGPPSDVISAYIDRLRGGGQADGEDDLAGVFRPAGIGRAMVAAKLNGRPILSFHTANVGDPLSLEVTLQLERPHRQCFLAILIEDEFGVRVWNLQSRWHIPRFDLSAGTHRLACEVDQSPLSPGRYRIGLALVDNQQQIDIVERVASLEVMGLDAFGTGEMPRAGDGYLLPPATWSVEAMRRGGTGS